MHPVWATGGTPDADLRYARSADRGHSFSAPMKVAASDGHSDAPSLAIDSSDPLHLAYAEWRDERGEDPPHTPVMKG